MPLGSELQSSVIKQLAAAIDEMKPVEAPATSQRDPYLDWLLKPPKAPTPPTHAATDWVRNPIDAFILARLDAKGMKPVGEVMSARLGTDDHAQAPLSLASGRCYTIGGFGGPGVFAFVLQVQSPAHGAERNGQFAHRLVAVVALPAQAPTHDAVQLCRDAFQ